MKKTYIIPAIETENYENASMLCGSLKIDDGNTVGGSGMLSNKLLWGEEDEEQVGF